MDGRTYHTALQNLGVNLDVKIELPKTNAKIDNVFAHAIEGMGQWVGVKVDDIAAKSHAIAIGIENKSSETFTIGDEHFESGKWVVGGNDPRIRPGESTMLFAANKDGSPQGVTGEVTYNGKTKKLHIAFNMPTIGKDGVMTDVTNINDKEDKIDKAKKANGWPYNDEVDGMEGLKLSP
jgi:hypothetical protein